MNCIAQLFNFSILVLIICTSMGIKDEDETKNAMFI